MYLGVLFLAAQWTEKLKPELGGSKWIYALSIPVYCTAWTYYGSVGKAVNDGWEFLTIYLGPILSIPLWWIVVRKMIKVCEVQRISTLPDFLADRYGKHLGISIFSSVFLVLGIIPYISIQLKAIVNSFNILTSQHSPAVEGIFFTDSSFYLSIILALFIVFFVFKSIETTDKHNGMMVAIALDSLVKLVAFLVVGCFVTFFLFDGFGDLFSRLTPAESIVFEQFPAESGLEWFFLLFLSLSAFLLLPRQFQVTIAENQDVNHLKTASWLVPLYLLLINLFVVPIAIAGKSILPEGIDPDAYVLALPLFKGLNGLAILTYLGGFSAAIGMIVVSTIALSLIVSNNIVVPLLLNRIDTSGTYTSLPLKSRRFAVFVILTFAYLYYKYVADAFSLVSIGLVSFAAIVQFVPAVLGALFWKDANKNGALGGLVVGFFVWGYTLVIPTIVKAGLLPISLIESGPFGISWLRPEAILGLQLQPIVHGTFWSLLANLACFFLGSLLTLQSAKEKNLAELYYDIWDYTDGGIGKVLWKGNLVYKDLIRVSTKLLGSNRTSQSLAYYQSIHGEPVNSDGIVEVSFVNHMERLLSGVVGSASARMVISSLAKEEELEMDEVLNILKETSETSLLNKELKSKSLELSKRTNELEVANSRLQALDREKDDFISTVTHELRTPLTSIKAFVEILEDGGMQDENDAKNFLGIINDEIDRMTRLINQVLDIEKLESGAATIEKLHSEPRQILEESIQSFEHLLKSKNILLKENYGEAFKQAFLPVDRDRMKQVFANLISNAIKYCDPEKPVIEVLGRIENGFMKICIVDNGQGIEQELLPRLFEKFFQGKDQTTKKPVGTGLGLSITKKIVELHGGSIHVESTLGRGSNFTIFLPLKNDFSEQKRMQLP